MKGDSVRVVLVGGTRALAGKLSRRLRPRKFSIQVAGSIDRADGMLRRQKCHVIVVDLPGDGDDSAEFLKTALSCDRDLSVIVLAEKPSVESVVRSFQCGAADYLAKPVSVDKLAQVLLEAARKKGLLREPPQAILSVVGERLRKRRRDLSLSLHHLSRRTGLSVSLLSQIERARSAASISSLHKIGQALDLPLCMLFDGL